MLDFRIATFLKLCETRSYTKTAKMLNITQPSVTQHVKYLQKKYQCKLFSYEGKMLNLTPEGEYLFAQAEAMTRMSAKVLSDLQRMNEERKALRFGCPSELGEVAVTRTVAALVKAGTIGPVDLTVQDTAKLTEMLESGQLDVILTDAACQCGQLACVPMAKVQYAGYAAPAYPECADGTLTQACLILRNPGAMDRTVLEQYLEQQKVPLHEFQGILTAGTAVSARELAVSGVGIIFTYASGVEDVVAQAGLRELVLPGIPIERSLAFFCKEDSQEAFTAFFHAFRDTWNQVQVSGNAE